MTDNFCPQCGAISPGSKAVCSCGYHFRPHFESSVIEREPENRHDPVTHRTAAPKSVPRVAAPTRPPEMPSGTLAARSVRFTAAVIDGLVLAAMAGVPYLIVSAEGWTYEDPALAVAWSVAVMLLLVQALLLSRLGQSIGKAAMGIRIVDVNTGRNAGFMKNVWMRVVVNSVLCMIPFYALVDLAMIFRQDRRCVHDLLAGTRVVDA